MRWDMRAFLRDAQAQSPRLSAAAPSPDKAAKPGCTN